MALGEFETDDLRHFMAAIRKGDVFVDIGANVGAYCVPIGHAFPDVNVFAFEPIPLNAALIQVSVLVNKLLNVQVVSKCVSDKTGVVEFSLAEDSAYSSMVDTHRKPEIAKLSCEAVTLDDFCSEQIRRIPDIVKIDVEGAELKVLNGGREIFGSPDKRPRLALIELYDQNLVVFGTSVAEVAVRMEHWGYQAYVLIEGQQVPFAREHHNVHYNVFFKA
jgi:FkbM family methyltransferase